MKKLISLILAVLLIISISVVPVFAQDTEEISYYQQKLFELYPDTKEAFEYDNLYYSDIAEIDVDCDDGMDYAVIFTHFAMAPDALDAGVIGNRFIIQPQLYNPFRFGYALYDLEEFKFIPFYEGMNNDYPFIEDCMEDLMIGAPFGDADLDQILTIMDATTIQRVLAQLEGFTYIEYMLSYVNLPTDYRSDFNLDGQVDITDATQIQLKLAGLI